MSTLRAVPFFFLRHGETDWNAQGLSQGQVDIPLNDTGLAQAAWAAQRLKNHGIVAMVCSTLGRARQTAEIVGAALELEFTTDPDLQEADFGAQEGKPMGSWYDDWVNGTYTPEGGEPFAALRIRIAGALNRALQQPGPILVVAHGAMFRAARAEMGLSALVRTDNGIPLLCTPGTPWTLTPVR